MIKGPFCTFKNDLGKNAYVAWNVETYEQGKNLLAGGGFDPGTENIVEGTCERYSNICTEQYAPVCGTIDAIGETKTYGNQCFLEVAAREAPGAGSKAAGTWTMGECAAQCGAAGDPCGGMMGLRCQEGLFCKYSSRAACGSLDMTGTCSKPTAMCPQVYEPVCVCDGRDYSNE